MVRQLGKVSDAKLAERFGLDKRRVSLERHRRGIPAVNGDLRKVRRSRALAKLLRRPTEEVCAVAGIHWRTVFKLREELGVAGPQRQSVWTPRVLAALGKKPDAQIAAELGLTEVYVARKRQERGLKLRQLRWWTAAEEALLGTAPDAVIARRLKRTVESVAKRRQRLVLAEQVKLEALPYKKGKRPGSQS
jgi:transcriptional regulator with XRE-family HTH domain